MNLGGLHVISDGRADESLIPALIAVAAGGASAIHLREPGLSARALFDLACALQRQLPAGVRLFINDRIDVASAVGADGVQLGQGSLAVVAARQLLPSGVLIGASVHTLAEVDAAQDADVLLLGTIFPSSSHPGGPTGGLALIEQVRARTRLPIVAIGGITAENAAAVRAAGADGIAVISAVLNDPHPRSAAARLAR